MKRRHRKTVLDINGDSDSPRRRWQNKYQQVIADQPEQNGAPGNPLTNLVGQYNSDSEADEERRPNNKLNDQVNDFLKEIQEITPENVEGPESSDYSSIPQPLWQECIDEATGYPYYWHTETNAVTWEMPPELHYYLEKTQQENASHSSHVSQWSSNCYPQTETNIPDGMIPKEVVARNRNRQAGIKQTKKEKSPAPSENKSPGRKDDSFDDGKIEMITSFGNEESESEESDHGFQHRKTSSKKSSKSAEHKRDSNFIKKSEGEPIGPQMAPMLYGPKNSSPPKKSQTTESNAKTNNASNISHLERNDSNENDMLRRLKNQAKLLQAAGKTSQLSSESRHGSEERIDRKKRSKLSLVPGYEDDSEGDDECHKKIKPLFPISEYEATPTTPISSTSETAKADKITRRIETESGCSRIFDYRGKESESIETANEGAHETEDTNRIDAEDNQEFEAAKANKFLESLEAPTKAFQRKKRLTFDVIPNKSKTQESQEKYTKDENSSTSSLGHPSESEPQKDEDSSETESSVTVGRSHNSPNKVSGNETQSVSASKENKSSMTQSEKNEFRLSVEMIMEKLRFLSEGSQPASGVQVMAIQLQTLLVAWESGDLHDNYIHTWLSGTSCELGRLEQTAAPSGWDCQWDRTHKRYYYRNLTTGEAQWTYPQVDVIGGTEEMELCTTPPPPEHEQSSIIEMRAHIQPEISEKTKATAAASEEKESVLVVPPPPQISSPSPPPPPKIYAEDLKRDKKRRASSNDSDSRESTGKEVRNPPLPSSPNAAQPPPPPLDSDKGLNNEPLPPGVDPPELAYSLTPNNIDAGVLYSHQTNPIYAATLGNAGMPLLGHHPGALMHGQVMHYPAYHHHHHHHLHNSLLLQQQALVAARINGQEAVQAIMMSEYARIYDNNQVIAKPPMKTARESLGSAINSFYSDIASIENKAEAEQKEYPESVPSPAQLTLQQEAEMSPIIDATKEKKKKKLKTGIGKKQKEMSSMVAKWQKAQKNFKDGH